MKTGIKIHKAEFQRSLQLYAAATKKDESEILNRAGKNVAFRAAQFTPRTPAGRISSELEANNKELAVRILSKRGAFRGASLRERRKIVRRFINARRKSGGYIRAGWGPAIAAFGGNATRLKVNPKSKLAKGYGLLANPRKLFAELANNAFGAHYAGLKPLQQAIDFVSKDMTSYALRKLFRTAKKHSA